MGELAGFLPIILIVLAFYFLLIRPQSKRAKQQRQMQSELAVGAEVMLTSGLFGRVVDTSHTERLEVSIADGVVITVARAAVATVVQPEVADAPVEHVDGRPDGHSDGYSGEDR